MNRYERAGFERGEIAARNGASLNDRPPVEETLPVTGTIVEHTESYLKAWDAGYAKVMFGSFEEVE